MPSPVHVSPNRGQAGPIASSDAAERLQSLRAEIDVATAKLSADGVLAFDAALIEARRVYVAGQGRSGLVGRSFAQRLMHIGFEAYAVGDIIVPAVGPGDLFVAITASGRTETTIRQATKAKKAGARIIALTEVAEGELADMANLVAQVPTRPPLGPESGQHATTLFCLVIQVLFDVLCSLLQQQLRQSDRDLNSRHSNLE